MYHRTGISKNADEICLDPLPNPPPLRGNSTVNQQRNPSNKFTDTILKEVDSPDSRNIYPCNASLNEPETKLPDLGNLPSVVDDILIGCELQPKRLAKSRSEQTENLDFHCKQAPESGGQSRKFPMDTRQRLLSRSQAHNAAANSSSSSNNVNNGNIPDQPNGSQLTGGAGVGNYPELNDDADSSDMLNSSSLADSELMSRRRLVNGLGDSDVDNGGPLDDGDDLELAYRMRRQSRRQRLLQRRRDSSLATTGTEADAMCSGNRRHREGSLSRGYRRAATTDDRSSQPPLPSGLSRSSTRVGQPIRSASIPPPPSEPPPSTPGMSPMLFDSNTGQNNPYAFYPLMNLNMIPQQLPYTATIQPTYIDQGELMNTNSPSQQFFQLRQASQMQQQLTAGAGIPLGGVPVGGPYLQGFATVGRPGRVGSLGQAQMAGLHPNSAVAAANMHALAGLGLISSNALLQAQAAAAAANAAAAASAAAPPSAGGSGSVVYENSYNSFQRLPISQCVGGGGTYLPSAISQDLISGCNGVGNSGIGGHLNDMSPSQANTTVTGGTSVPSSCPGGGPQNPEAAGLLLKAAGDGSDKTLGMPPSSVGAAVASLHPSVAATGYLEQNYAVNSFGGATAAAAASATMRSKPTDAVSSTAAPKPFFWRCSWHYWVILICVLAFLLTLSFAVFFSENAKWLENRLHERFSQDPIIFGLFDPQRPPHQVEAGQPVKIHLQPMGLWSGQWRVPGDRCTVYNVTITSTLSALTSVGVFLRYSTMPTIVHYNYFDRIVGRQLRADAVGNEAATSSLSQRSVGGSASVSAPRSSTSAGGGGAIEAPAGPNLPRTTGRVRCLKKGLWFISIVNDQPRKEELILSMAEVTMQRGCPNDCSNRGICSQGVCDCLLGQTGRDCSTPEEVPICSGHGEYFQGSCRCFPEWKGLECETLWSECIDATCSGQGRCVTGGCQCFAGFAGESCEIRTCGLHNCSGNGICIDGVCRCFQGWLGEACSQPLDSVHFPEASSVSPNSASPPSPSSPVPDRGKTIEAGDVGLLKDSPSSDLADAFCSFNGHRDVNGLCRCKPGFEGKTCDKDASCTSLCVHGVCIERSQSPLVGFPTSLMSVAPAVCLCNDGWRGVYCDIPTCGSACLRNGQCVDDVCVCNRGWNGLTCNLYGCPLDCSEQGQCLRNSDGQYYCHCLSNRKGSACQVPIEISCNDGRDDDQDGLIDCLDPDCCGTPHCEKLTRVRGNQQAVEDARESCAHSNDLSGLILSTKVAPPGSSFYEQLEFLMLRDVTTDKVDPRRVSVVRGVVRQWDGTPFWGCRVFDRLNLVVGSTLTDKNGRFELVVEGGYLVHLEFVRHPTSRFTAQLDLYVPVNQIVNVGDFYLMDRLVDPPHWMPAPRFQGAVVGVGGALPASPVFADLWVAGLHPGASLASGPVTSAVTTPGTPSPPKGGCADGVHDTSLVGGPSLTTPDSTDDFRICLDITESVCVDQGVLMHRIALEPSNLHLTYTSNHADHKSVSTLIIGLLTADRPPPEDLLEVHLLIDVAGLRKFWRFEPSRGLQYTFLWNRTDGYNRSVYGTIPAKVSAGYLYAGCLTVFWEKKVVQLKGHDIVNPDLSNWNLDARHVYSPTQNIVYLGDGQRIEASAESLVVKILLGKPNVRRSPDQCASCGGKALGNPVFHLSALATDETGRLLVGDGHFLRTLQPPMYSDDSTSSVSARDSTFNRPQSDDAGSPTNAGWTVSDVRVLPFAAPGVDSEENLLADYFIARHPISVEDREALSRGGIGAGRAGLFVSDARNKAIWWISLIRRDFHQMFIGEQCPPNDTFPDCFRMQLTHPKGLVVTFNEDLFFLDDKRLWRHPLRRSPSPLDSQKQSRIRVEHVIGQMGEATGPLPCGRSLHASKVQLVAPTSLAYNPVEDSVYYVDEKRVFRLDLASRMVSLAAGRLPGCPPSQRGGQPTSLPPLAIDFEFSEIRSIAFSVHGELLIAESEVIWIRRSDDRLHLFAGARTSTPWNSVVQTNLHRILQTPTPTRLPFDQLTPSPPLTPARDFRFSNITFIAVGIFNDVYVADGGHNVVVSIFSEPQRTSVNGRPTNDLYKVSSLNPIREEYLFNRHGQVKYLVDTLTQHPIYTFAYKASVLNGWLASVRRGSGGGLLTLERDNRGLPQFFTLDSGGTYNMSFAADKRIDRITDPFGAVHRYESSPSGFLSKLWTPSSALPFLFIYSPTSGLVESIVTPSGLVASIHALVGHIEGLTPRARSASSSAIPVIYKNAFGTYSIQSSEDATHITYDEGAQKLMFDRITAPSLADHLSWQLNRRIRILVVPSKLAPNGGDLTRTTPGVGKGAIDTNSSEPLQQYIENTVTSSIEVSGPRKPPVGHDTMEGTQGRRRRSSFLRLGRSRRGALDMGARVPRGSYPNSRRRDTSASTSDAVSQRTRKTLSINGLPILSVVYDRESLTEVFRSPITNKFLLRIVYNSDMQPTVFTTIPAKTERSGFLDTSATSASSDSSVDNISPILADLRLHYSRHGLLKEAFWGHSTYRFSYDSLQRLRTVELGSTLDTLAFDYQNPLFPHLRTEVSVSGAGTYRLLYNHESADGSSENNLGLSHVITPSGLYRSFSSFTSVGVQRFSFMPWSSAPGPFIFDWETRMLPAVSAGLSLARFTWPSGRRINVLNSKRLIVYDNIRIYWSSSPPASPLDAPFVILTDAMVDFSIQQYRDYGTGRLPTAVRGLLSLAGTGTVRPEIGGLLSYSHEYEYDSNLRPSSIRSCLLPPLGAHGVKSEPSTFSSTFFTTTNPLVCHNSRLTFRDWSGYTISPLEVDIVYEPLTTSITWTPGGLRVHRRLDNRGRLRAIVLEEIPISKLPLFNMTYSYEGELLYPSDLTIERLGEVPQYTRFQRGPGGRIEGMENEEVGSSRLQHLQVIYNEEARLAELRHYVSDSQFIAGRHSGESQRVSTKFTYDSRGLLSGLGQWKYHFNDDGLLTDRRWVGDQEEVLDRFEYDSKGLLRWARRWVYRKEKSKKATSQAGRKTPSLGAACSGFPCFPWEAGTLTDFSVQYLYDAEDRLVVVRNTLAIADLVQFFYADPQNRNRLTAVFHHGRGRAYFLTYDQDQGFLFAVEERVLASTTVGNSSDLPPSQKLGLYLVLSDANGSPVALFDSTKMLWTAEYSCTGSRRFLHLGQSSPDYEIVWLGYGGNLIDPHTGFLFLLPTWQAYDPVGATATAPDWRRAPNWRLQNFGHQPYLLDLHRWDLDHRDPLALLQAAVTQPAWWIRRLDPNVERMLPHFEVENGRVLKSSLEMATTSVPDSPLPTGCGLRPFFMPTNKHLRQATWINEDIERLGIVDWPRLSAQTIFDPRVMLRAVKPSDCGVTHLHVHTVPPMFGSEVSFSLSVDGTISVYPAVTSNTPDRLKKQQPVSAATIAHVLLFGTKLMDSWYLSPLSSSSSQQALPPGLAVTTSFVQLFVKVTPTPIAQLEVDLAALQLTPTQLTTATRVGISLGPRSHLALSGWAGLDMRLDSSDGLELRLTAPATPGVEWRVRYVESWVVASARVLREARRRGEEAAWRRAARVLRTPSGRGFQADEVIPSPKPWPTWTASEADQLFQSERVQGYHWEPVVFEPPVKTVLSELLDDPSIYQIRPDSLETTLT